MTNPVFDALIAPHLGRDTPFLHLPDGACLTHGMFFAQAAQMAGALTALGLVPGDRVAVQVPKSPQALMLYAAALQAGLVFLPLNTAYTGAELGYFITDSEAALVVCAPERAEALAPITAQSGAHLLTLDAAGGGSLMDACAEAAPMRGAVPRAADDLAALLYTSGTTGRSKGAMLTQTNLLSNARALTDLWRFEAGDVLLHMLPIYHAHGLFVAINVSLLAGNALLFEPKFDARRAMELLPRATTMMGIPTFYTRLLAEPGFDAETCRTMRLFISGSAPLLAETHRAFAKRSGHMILERYGMTETGMNSSNPYEGARRAGTVGHPLAGIEIRITDPDSGIELPQGEIGMVEVRGPNVFCGYWRMPEKTRAELRPNGFFITGDLGQIDAEGYLVIVGRGKDLIISGGLNIYPKEVETLLDAQPGVIESAVIGVPHPDFGETPVALVVPGPDAPSIETLDAALRRELARFKHPRRILLVPELPRNAMGKVQKAALRTRYADLFGT